MENSQKKSNEQHTGRDAHLPLITGIREQNYSEIILHIHPNSKHFRVDNIECGKGACKQDSLTHSSGSIIDTTFLEVLWQHPSTINM